MQFQTKFIRGKHNLSTSLKNQGNCPKSSSRSREKPGRIEVVTASPSVSGLEEEYFPDSCKIYWKNAFSWGTTIQYSFTPASSYTSYLFRSSFLLLPGERISTTISGAPRQPRSSSLAGSQMTQISGWTTV